MEFEKQDLNKDDYKIGKNNMGYYEVLNKPTKEELYDCINNKEAVGKLVKVPTRMFKGPEGPILAATVI